MTEHTDPTTIEQVNALMDSLAFTDEPIDLPLDTQQDSDAGLRPYSIKMSAELNTRVTARAVRLGMSKSAYFRWLAAQDLAKEADGSESAAKLSRIADQLTKVADELRHTA